MHYLLAAFVGGCVLATLLRARFVLTYDVIQRTVFTYCARVIGGRGTASGTMDRHIRARGTRRAGGDCGVAHAHVVVFTVHEVEVLICCVLVRCVCTVNKVYIFSGGRYSMTAGTRRTAMGGSYRGAVARLQYKNTVSFYGDGYPWLRSHRVPVVRVCKPNIPCRPSDTDSCTRCGWQTRNCRNEGTVKRRGAVVRSARDREICSAGAGEE